MMSWLLFAQESTVSTILPKTLEFARMPQSPLGWVLLVTACLLVGAFVIFTYLRDGVELSGWLCGLLALLRITAFVGLLLIWLQPQWRLETVLRQDSIVPVLLDVSLSMSLQDPKDNESLAKAPTRGQRMIDALSKGRLLPELRKNHEVLVVAFGQDEETIARLPRMGSDLPGSAGAPQDPPADAKPAIRSETDIKWAEVLNPRDDETRLGQALRRVLSEENARNLVGMIVFSDGQHNSGVDTDVAIKLATQNRDNLTKICTVGVGSTQMPLNVRIGDLVAPARAFPGDNYLIRAYLQGQGLPTVGQEVKVELTSRPAGKEATDEKVEASETVIVPGDGQPVAVPFELKAETPGRRTLQVRIQPVAKDNNPKDDAQEADVEIVERKTKVLLFAGGPTREYQFLRNQLYRDAEIQVDVLLQLNLPGSSQDAKKILTTFPTAAELGEYDCVVAFDPDWTKLNSEQIDGLEKWVAEQSGGMVVIAGPVYTEKWVGRQDMEKIRALYPVEFKRHQALLDAGRFENTEPRQLVLTRDGLEAQFLWIAEEAASSKRIWGEFAGVYGFYSVRRSKPLAKIYARFQDLEGTEADTQPVYFAGHFYGSGRVFYLGSGEMWRLRAIDPTYFERFYTKLVRHVTEGRLLRGSRRGVLLADRDRYLLGQTAIVRAQLFDNEFQPLTTPSVPLEIIPPDQSPPFQIELKPDLSGRKGMYQGQFVTRLEGTYRLELAPPEGGEEDRLTKRITARISDLERERPQLDEPRLKDLADRTGGTYVDGPEKADSLAALLPARPTTRYRLESPETIWNQNLQTWLRIPDESPWLQRPVAREFLQWPFCLLVLTSVLFLEWTIRRLARLA